jgi:hypothetical protein
MTTTATVRRTARACALVTAPLLLLAAHLLQPGHAADTASEVAAQAAHTGAFRLSTVVGLLATVALVPAVSGLTGLVRDRWSGLVGGALALAGVMGLCFLLGTGAAATVLADEGGAQAVALTDALESDPAFGAGVALMLIGWTFGLLVLAVALGRSRAVPWWSAVCLGVAPFVPAVAGGKVPVAVGFLLLLVAFAVAASRLVRVPEHQEVGDVRLVA